jgi:hypothetical protein
MKKYDFNTFTLKDTERLFQLRRDDDLPFIKDWLNAPLVVPDEETTAHLERLRKIFLVWKDHWNESEARTRFSIPLLDLVGFNLPPFQPFLQKRVFFEKRECRIHGQVDWSLARAVEQTSPPIFFLQDQKRFRKNDDPLAQLIAAMMISKMHLKEKFIGMGACVIGAEWRWVAADRDVYAVSAPLSPTQLTELIRLYSQLLWAKATLVNHIEAHFKSKSVLQMR